MNKLLIATLLSFACVTVKAAEVAGVFVDEEIRTPDGETLVLNGAGLREKFWVDVYVGSLYLPRPARDVGAILSHPGPLRIQLDFVYKEVARDQLLESWREGFDNNLPESDLPALQDRIEQFYALFDSSALARDRYRFDYQPASGTRVSKNGEALGVIPGEDFRNALLEIWLGNHPADKDLKKAMLGL